MQARFVSGHAFRHATTAAHDCAFRRWIWTFAFHSGLLGPTRLTETIPTLIAFDSVSNSVLLCAYTGKEVVG